MAELNAEFAAVGKKKYAQDDLDRMVHEAVVLGSANFLTLTLSSGGKADGLSHAVRPLAIAIQKRSPGMVQALIDAGADVNKPVFDDGTTPMMLCISHGQHDIVGRLIAAGADLNARNGIGNTALFEAAENGDDASFAKILSAGADPSITGRDGKTVRDVLEENAVANTVEAMAAAKRMLALLDAPKAGAKPQVGMKR